MGTVLYCVLCAAPAFAQQTHLLVVIGVPGDEEHQKKFEKWAASFVDAAKKKDAVPEANITQLADRRATKEGVEKAIADIAGRAKPNDTVFILLIGHGSFDGRVATFNLMGPDLSAADYAKLLSKFTSQRVVFVNTASASGAFLPTLAAPGRVVVTATKTGGERNEPDFPEYFVAAYNDDAADRDRTGRTDATLSVDMTNPAVRALVEERDAIEQRIAALKLMKPSMDETAYDAQMEKLLTDLALKTKALRDLQTKKDRS